jgi:putative transposase
MNGGVQRTCRQTRERWTDDYGSGEGAWPEQPEPAQLDQGRDGRQAHGRWQQGHHAGSDGAFPAARRGRSPDAGERIHNKSSGVLRARCSVKYAWIGAHIKRFALIECALCSRWSVSGYRAWKRGGKPDRKRLTDDQMLAVIRAIHAELKSAYGSPRMMRELRLRCFTAGKERVERLMRENGICARHKRRYRVTKDSKHGLPVAENLLNRNFTSAAPNQVWTSDITYLWTDEGWLYLAIVLDLFNREVIGWSLKPRMTADIATDALTMAWFRRQPAAGVMHHSDRGSQYASDVFQDKLKEYGMTCSMSRKGNCWDNAPTESWFNSFKNERFHGVRYATHAEMKAASFEYIEVFYNRKRRHSTLGYSSPLQYLDRWISEQTRMSGLHKIRLLEDEISREPQRYKFSGWAPA